MKAYTVTYLKRYQTTILAGNPLEAAAHARVALKMKSQVEPGGDVLLSVEERHVGPAVDSVSVPNTAA